MKRVFQTAVFTLCLVVFSHGATVPAQNMSAYSLGAEYFGMLHGHNALTDFDTSAIGAHFMRLHYSPLSWLRISAGFGGSHMYSDPVKNGSKVDIAATAGFGLYVPKVFDFLSITAGYDGYYLKASEKSEFYHMNIHPESSDTVMYLGKSIEGYTAANLQTPYLGLVFHAGRSVDFEIGGLYQYFEITKKNRTNYESAGVDTQNDAMFIADYQDLATRGLDPLMEQLRLYTTLTLHERESGAYLTGGFSYALTDQGDNDKSHLTNFSFWAQIGLIMRDPRGTAHNHRGYDSGYARLKRRQDRMAGELARDIDRDRQRQQAERRKSRSEADDMEDDENDGDIIIINIED